jgi:23S rRNA pseudouridine1911/1915/1917 synthase
MSNTDRKGLPEILFEDNHLIAVNKRSGDIVQGDKTGDAPLSELLKSYIKDKYGKPGEVFLGVVHRLDRPVSGIVVFARTSKALARMNELFRERKTRKTYWAVVRNAPPAASGSLVHYLKKDEKSNKSRAYDQEVPGSSRAWLDYRLLGRSDHYFLLEVLPHTGRHHQIRVQLSAMGCPIKGDVKYGAERTNENGSIHLHARRLVFQHPVRKEELSLTADPPADPVWDHFRKSLPGNA